MSTLSAVQPDTHTRYEQASREAFAQQLAALDAPDWLLARRQQAFSRYEVLGFPNTHHESWRYIDLKPVANGAYVPYEAKTTLAPEQVAPYLLAAAEGTVEAPIRLVFVNGDYEAAFSTVDGLPASVIVTDLQTALQLHPDLVKQHLAITLGQEADAFAALNGALFTQGAFLYVPENVQLNVPVQLLFLSTGEVEGAPPAAYTRSLCVVGKQAKCQLLIQFEGLQPTPYLNNFVSEVVVGEEAQVDYAFLQGESGQALHFATTKLFLKAQSQVRMTSIAVEGATTRNNIEADLLGEGGLCCLNGLSILSRQSQAYQLTTVNHLVPQGESHQLYKTIVDDAARSEFNGTIFVARDAQLTDSTQLSRSLILSDEARVFTRPQLRIDADDVKCSHGATVGQLDEEQLFYLTSRGIDEAEARNLLTYGFAEDVVEKILDPTIRKHVEGMILEQLQPVNQAEA